MAYVPYWVLLAITVILAVITVYFRKFRFIDFQSLIMFWAASFALDMLFCKWLGYFHWVDMKHRGFYSFWVCLLFYPSVAVIFLKFRPEPTRWVCIYIVLWAIFLTLIELFIIKPLHIVYYPKWRIIPWSPFGYAVVLAWIHIYYKIIEKRLRC